jgi:hypothetical protein
MLPSTASSEHLTIVNATYPLGKNNYFHFFPKLPTEIRLRIWRCSLEQQRLLQIQVEKRHLEDNHPYQAQEKNDGLIDKPNYDINVAGACLNSKILSVNVESRQSALNFYRIHIPSDPGKTKDGSRTNVLYVNPEYDFVFIQANLFPEGAIANLLSNIKNLDPRYVGLRKLALDETGIQNLTATEEISSFRGASTFVDCLCSLEEIIWVAESTVGRACTGWRQDYPNVGVRFNHSMPLRSITPIFELLAKDPRPIGFDLKYVLTANGDPRRMRLDWQELLARWKIRHKQPIKERVLFATRNPRNHIYDAPKAAEYLKTEEERWVELQRTRPRIFTMDSGKLPYEDAEKLSNAVRPAIGFWLFPAEALGSLEGDLSGRKMTFDMTGHWPELALSCFY